MGIALFGVNKPRKITWEIKFLFSLVISSYQLSGVPVDAHTKTVAIFVYNGLPKIQICSH